MKEADPNGVVVVRHGVLVYEHYFAGWDVRWERPAGRIPHDARTLHRIESITKSVVAILTGIAVDRGLLADVSAPILSFFPEDSDLRTPEKAAITVRDLLTMTSGTKWPEWAVFYNSALNINRRRILTEPRPNRFVLEQPMVAEPGTTWNCNGGGVGLLGAILQEVTHQRLDTFAKRALFGPLDINRWKWDVMANGEPSASGGLWLRPRDLAKIGQLVLNHGTWHGRRIVSADWVKQMTAPQLPRWYLLQIGGAYSYGYLWWLGRSWVHGHQFDWVAGLGYGGQRLYVVPSQDLVVVVTAGVYRHSYAQDLAGDTTLNMALRAAFRH